MWAPSPFNLSPRGGLAGCTPGAHMLPRSHPGCWPAAGLRLHNVAGAALLQQAQHLTRAAKSRPWPRLWIRRRTPAGVAGALDWMQRVQAHQITCGDPLARRVGPTPITPADSILPSTRRRPQRRPLSGAEPPQHPGSPSASGPLGWRPQAAAQPPGIHTGGQAGVGEAIADQA